VCVESHERGRQSLEILQIGCGREVEILCRPPTPMHLRGDSTDHEIVHPVLREHPKQLAEVQRTFRDIAHAGT